MGVSQDTVLHRESWLTLSKHKKEDQYINILGRRKPSARENFEAAFGLNCKEGKKWIR